MSSVVSSSPVAGVENGINSSVKEGETPGRDATVGGSRPGTVMSKGGNASICDIGEACLWPLGGSAGCG